MTLTIAIDNQKIDSLDLSAACDTIAPLLENNRVASYEQQLRFNINYQLETNDPRELSEIPQIRLWYVRLDAVYPWLPFLLDWKAGELARYGAMLVPHQFSRSEGIIYNPEALEIFVMSKIFILSDWLLQQGISPQFRLKSMAQTFGYDIDDAFLQTIR